MGSASSQSQVQHGGNGNDDARRHAIRKHVRYLQVLLDHLRQTDERNDYERPWLQKEIESVAGRLERLGVPRSSLNLEEDVWEDAQEYLEPKMKQVKFGKSHVAFY